MPIDVGQATSFLRDRFDGRASGVAIAGNGQWSHAYSFRHDGGDFVIRFGAHVEDFMKDRAAAGFASRAFPTPAVQEIGEAYGSYYCVSTRAFGTHLDDLDEAGMRAALPALFRGLDDARAIEVNDDAGFGLWGDRPALHASWRAFLLDVARDDPLHRTHGWRERLDASPVGDCGFEAGVERLASLVDACPEERHIVHSDLLNHNVLVASAELTAVFDWGCSLYGDFLYDIAWLTFWGPWYPSMRNLDITALARDHYRAIGLDVPRFEERLRCNELHIGLNGMSYQAFIGDWDNFQWTGQRIRAIPRD